MSNYRSTKDIAATVRKTLKTEFPTCKFSVTAERSRSLTVALMEAPFKIFEKDTDVHGYKVKGSVSLNHHSLKQENAQRYNYQTGEVETRCNGGAFLTAKAWEVMVRVCEVANAENWDESDIQTDYFNCNYYLSLRIGKWDKPVVEGDVVEEVAPVAEIVEAVEAVAQAVEESSPASVEIEAQSAQPVTVRIFAQPGDIRAKGAFDGTSFSPERREQQYINSYLEQMAEVAKEFGQWATADNVDEINQALELYRAGYAQRYNECLSAHSRIRSQMITGAGGWTSQMVRSMEKKNATYDSRNRDLIEWNGKAIDRLYNQFNPRFIAKAPIMSSDHDALEKLQEKIAKAEKNQQDMKQANVAIRKHAAAGHDAQVKALATLGYNLAQAVELLKPDYCGRVGFADYELTNNNANICRMKQRVVEIERLRATPTKGTEVVTSAGEDSKIRIVDNTEANRLQLFFPGKPSEEIRSKLKENGFRWTPSVGCWQAYRNYRAQACADEVLKMA